MLDGLLLAAVLFAWGTQATVPLKLPGASPAARRLWAYAALPLLVAGALAATAYVRLHPEAAVAQGLFPFLASKPGRVLAILLAALFLADLVTAFGWRRLEDSGWRIAAGFGLAGLAAASWVGELVRTGEGPPSPGSALAAAAACRLLLALAAGEIVSPGRPLFAAAAGLALPVYWLVLPAPLSADLAQGRQQVALGAAALLLLAARWVPAVLRRPTLAAGVLLASLFLARVATRSQFLGETTFPSTGFPGMVIEEVR
jgi:hypothetical protein